MIFSNPDRRRFLRFSLAGAAIASAAGVLGGAGVAQAQKKAQTQASATGSGGAYPVIVLNSRDADLSLIDPKSHQVIGRIPTGKEPHHLYPTPDNRLVVVGNAMSDSLTFLDPATGTVMHAVSGVDDPYHLGFSPDQNFFVTCANRLDHVDVYRRVGHGDEMKLQGLARFNLAKTPSHLVFSDDSRVVYVTLQESHELVAIDLRRLVVLWRFAVGNLPAGVAISPDSKLIFVGVMAGYGLWNDLKTDIAPQQMISEAGIIDVPRAEDGHYYLTLQINGTPVQFLADTGATNMVLSQSDARRIGIDPDTLVYLGTAQTANGIVRTARVELPTVELGPYRDAEFSAWVNDGDMDKSLLGMDYLSLYRVELAGNKMILRR